MQGLLDGGTYDTTGTFVAPDTLTASASVLGSIYLDGGNDNTGFLSSSKLRCDTRIAATSSTRDTASALTVSASNTLECYYDATNKGACLNSSCSTTAVGLAPLGGPVTMYVGSQHTIGHEAGGVVKSFTVSSVAGGNCTSCVRTAWLGDSLSANTVASTGSSPINPRAPEQYASKSGRVVDNWAHNGATLLTNIEGQWTLFGAPSGAKRIIVWGGINDIIIGQVPGHTLWTTYKVFTDARLAEGNALVLINLTSFGTYSGWTSGLQTEADNFNSDMAAYCGGSPAGVTCIDMQTALWDPAAHLNLLAANAAPDGLHLSQVGATLAGNTVFAGAP